MISLAELEGRGMISAAFSPDRVHRYTWRMVLDPEDADAEHRVLFVMLNPSTADELGPDPTIRRCIGFARAWGYATVEVVNLFSLRSTDPLALYDPDPRGLDGTLPEGDPENLIAITSAAERADFVAAWGIHGRLRGRGVAVATELRRRGHALHHLGLTKGGQPRHPLYLAGDTQPTPWRAE